MHATTLKKNRGFYCYLNQVSRKSDEFLVMKILGLTLILYFVFVIVNSQNKYRYDDYYVPKAANLAYKRPAECTHAQLLKPNNKEDKLTDGKFQKAKTDPYDGMEYASYVYKPTCTIELPVKFRIKAIRIWAKFGTYGNFPYYLMPFVIGLGETKDTIHPVFQLPYNKRVPNPLLVFEPIDEPSQWISISAHLKTNFEVDEVEVFAVPVEEFKPITTTTPRPTTAAIFKTVKFTRPTRPPPITTLPVLADDPFTVPPESLQMQMERLKKCRMMCWAVVIGTGIVLLLILWIFCLVLKASISPDSSENAGYNSNFDEPDYRDYSHMTQLGYFRKTNYPHDEIWSYRPRKPEPWSQASQPRVQIAKSGFMSGSTNAREDIRRAPSAVIIPEEDEEEISSSEESLLRAAI